MNDRGQINFAADNRSNIGFFTFRDDFCINSSVAFIDAKNDGLASRSTATLAAHSASTKVRLIKFDVARERRFTLTMLGNGLANQPQVTIHGISIQSRQSGDLRGGQIERKELDDLPNLAREIRAWAKCLELNVRP